MSIYHKNDIIEENNDNIHNKLMEGDLGHCELYYEEYKNDIFVTKKNGDAYVYDDISALWIEKDNNYFIYSIALFLRKTVMEQIEKISNTGKKTKDDNEFKSIAFKTNELNNLLKIVQRTQHAKNVWSMVCSRFYKLDFIKSLDNIKYLLPINNNKVVNLKTGLTETD